MAAPKRSAAGEIVSQVRVDVNSPWFVGHFPDFPVLPGIAQLKMVVDMLAESLGKDLHILSVSRVKFKKLVVPEINASELSKNDKIIANPNCSTIQLVMVLHPLNLKYNLKRVIVSTYQSVTGTGKNAVDQLNAEITGDNDVAKVYPYEIFKNALPQCDVFAEDDYTKEEIKLMTEPKKIMGDDSFNLSATAVRVPVQGGHSESVNIEFENDFDLDEVRKILSETPGVVVMDDVSNKIYPMPLYSEGKDEVFVGRIRRDRSQPNTLNMWIVADNLRKGAATNAVQIAEYLLKNHLV